MKKSLYVFLSSMLGALLFLTIHRVLLFLYLIFISADYGRFAPRISYLEFLALDLFTMMVALLLGAWYGIWLGMSWFEKVYEVGSHGGLVSHIVEHYWPKPRQNYHLKSKIGEVQKKLERDLSQLKDLASASPASIASPEPIKKTIVRKRAPSKLKALK